MLSFQAKSTDLFQYNEGWGGRCNPVVDVGRVVMAADDVLFRAYGQSLVIMNVGSWVRSRTVYQNNGRADRWN